MWINRKGSVVYYSINEIAEANRKAGQVWFSEDTMAFWETVIYPTVWRVDGGAYFITSDRDAFDGRAFSVRFCDKDGRISTPSFQETATYGEARKVLKGLVPNS